MRRYTARPWNCVSNTTSKSVMIACVLGDVGAALRAACAAQKDGKTTVLEMMVTRELGDPFRRDALALPIRHLAKYQATAAKQ